MISIFNGRSRTLGERRRSVFAQIDVEFRQHLRVVKGARLHVLLAIALHADEEGWAWPSYETLKRETGYNEHTIARALGDLCQLEIEAHRLLLRYQPIDENGQYLSNRYLIFPTPEEVKQYEDESEPYAHFVHAENAHAEKVHTNKNQTKEEPSYDNGVSEQLATRLMALGVHEGQARKWASARPAEMILGWIEYVRRNGHGLENVPGFLVAKLKAGEPPPTAECPAADRCRYIDGPYAHLIEH